MQMDEGLDTGPMLVRESLVIDPRETAATLHDRLAALGADMLRRWLDDILTGRVSPTVQDEAAMTYAPMIDKAAGAIDWTRDAATIDRLVRAMTPWPGAFTEWAGETLKITRARPLAGAATGHPGYVVRAAEGVAVATGDGLLLLDEVQPPGKRPMPAADFARGRPDFLGAVLGAAG